MLTLTLQRIRAQADGARRGAAGLALASTLALAWIVLLVTAPAHARIESPRDTGGWTVPDAVSAPTQAGAVLAARVTPTRVAGLDGVHVDGGWLLR